MAKPKCKRLNINDLKDRVQNLSKASCTVMEETATVCLELKGHASGVAFRVTGTKRATFDLYWNPANDVIRRTWNDSAEATEYGACALSFLLILELTEYTLIERSRKGTGFDYWLGDKGDELFQKKARLEISGILSEEASKIDTRIREKLAQTNQSDKTRLPAFVCVVGFGSPCAKLVKK